MAVSNFDLHHVTYAPVFWGCSIYTTNKHTRLVRTRPCKLADNACALRSQHERQDATPKVWVHKRKLWEEEEEEANAYQVHQKAATTVPTVMLSGMYSTTWLTPRYVPQPRNVGCNTVQKPCACFEARANAAPLISSQLETMHMAAHLASRPNATPLWPPSRRSE